MMRRLGSALGWLLSAPILLLVHVASFALAPWRIGRMVQTVSLPRMREHRLRTVLTTLGISLGVAVLVAVVLVSRSVIVSVTATVDDLAGKADLQVQAGASGVNESVIDTVREVPGVYKVTPTLQQIATLRSATGRRERLLILGVDLLGSEDSYFREYASKELTEIRRDPLAFLNSSTNIILSRELANRIGLHLHDKVAITTGSGVKQFEVWGFIESHGVGRAFGGAVGVMYYPAMQVAFDRGRNIDRVEVAVEPGASAEPVAKRLQAKLGAGFVIQRPSLRGDRVSKMLTALSTALTMSSLIALISGAFLAFGTMSISVAQRKRELGVMRALGTKRGELLRLITLEGVLLGMVGSTLGVALGVLISGGMLKLTSRAVNAVYMQQAVSEVRMDWGVALAGLLLGMLCATIAAAMAARRATYIRPVEALNGSTLLSVALPSRRFNRADLIGVTLAAGSFGLLALPPWGGQPLGPLAALLTTTLAGRALMPRIIQLTHAFLSLFKRYGIGAELTLATDNLPRDVGRTASMASGLMAGVGLSVGISTFIFSFITSMTTWSTQSVPGDLFVTSGAAVSFGSGSNTPMSDDLRAQLLAIPGVERLRSTRSGEIDFRGIPVKLISIDVDRSFVRGGRLPLLEGSTDQTYDDVEAGAVVVSENFSRRFKVHRGDQIQLSVSDTTRSFPVAAVAIDYSSDLGTISIGRPTFLKYWGDSRVDTYELKVRRGVDPVKVRRAIQDQLGETHDLFVLTNREFRGEFLKAIDQVFSVMKVLEVVTLLVALLGMITSLLANVIDRIREIGVLRAIGMRRAQIRRLVLIEAALVGTIGTVAGVVLGLTNGHMLIEHVTTVQTGWYLPYHIPLAAIVKLALITIPVSALAGFFPARQAAALVVRDALESQ